jgi:pimeloyl-ACP methyl ester carboxylesterase
VRQALSVVVAGLVLGTLTGCVSDFGDRAKYGVTFYCPGAGVDLGDAGVREGLEQAGYRGQVVRATWSVSCNPALDQTVRVIAQTGARRLARCIEEYTSRYPDREVNLVGLSAGTGVAIWALENLKASCHVTNVVLIASSLDYKYDVSRALQHVRGRIYNYYSPTDAVLLGPMKVFGTIDGVFLEDGAGTVGLRVPPGTGTRVVNIAWRPEFEQFGYYGGHMDGTNASFVQHEIAKYIVRPGGDARTRTASANPSATNPRVGKSD